MPKQKPDRKAKSDPKPKLDLAPKALKRIVRDLPQPLGQIIVIQEIEAPDVDAVRIPTDQADQYDAFRLLSQLPEIADAAREVLGLERFVIEQTSIVPVMRTEDDDQHYGLVVAFYTADEGVVQCLVIPFEDGTEIRVSQATEE